jgi:peptidoglycan/LPS O-acetylase OafA/YrhL
LEPGAQGPWTQVFFLLTRLGSEAVVMFFVLSGYLVGGKVIERCREGSFDLRSFIVDRVTRLWVPYVPALVLTGVVAGLIGGVDRSGWILVGNLLQLQGVLVVPYGENAPLWSLSYEFWFYGLAGLLAMMMQKRGLQGAVLAGIALVFVVFTQLWPSRLFCWVLGALAYGVAVRQRGLMLLVGLGLSGGAALFLQRGGVTMEQVQILNVGLSFGLALGLTALTGWHPVSRFVRRIEVWGEKWAAFSFTLYLVHYPILRFLSYHWPEKSVRMDGVALMGFGAKIVICCFLAWIMYALFEAHTAKVRRWLRGMVIFSPQR